MKRPICMLSAAVGLLLLLAACTGSSGDEPKTHTEITPAEQTMEIDADIPADIPEDMPAEEEPVVTEEIATVPETGLFDTDEEGGIDLPFVPFAD